MHQQFYYQLRAAKDGFKQGVIHPLIALDQSKAQMYPLAQQVEAKTHDELHAWVVERLASDALEPTTRAHLEVAHTHPGQRTSATDVAQWMLFAEAFLRQQRHRNLIGDRPEQLEAWRTWLQEQTFDATTLPDTVKEYFSGCSTGREALALMQESPSLEWNTALMVVLNPTCKVDPAGRSHESQAVQPRVMANHGRYGWTLSYSVTHLDYSQTYTSTHEDDEGNVLDLGLDGKEATASKMTSMAQKDENGAWKDRASSTTDSASVWLDGMLLTLRHNKDIKRDVLQGIVEMAISAGIPPTQIIKNELPKTQFKGSGVSKAMLEVVTGRDWATRKNCPCTCGFISRMLRRNRTTCRLYRNGHYWQHH